MSVMSVDACGVAIEVLVFLYGKISIIICYIYIANDTVLDCMRHITYDL